MRNAKIGHPNDNKLSCDEVLGDFLLASAHPTKKENCNCKIRAPLFSFVTGVWEGRIKNCGARALRVSLEGSGLVHSTL